MASVFSIVFTSSGDKLSKELSAMTGEVVIEDIEDLNKTTLSFINDSAQAFSVNIKYRAINQSDINSNNPFSYFANIFNNFISGYNSFLSLFGITPPFHPSFSNSTKTIAFNIILGPFKHKRKEIMSSE